MTDLLGAVRLSDVTDETTSPERQRKHINDYATFKGHQVIHIAEDVDVSGAVSPFARDGIGPWLRAPLLDRWQILAVAKLDRLTRSILDFETLWKFLDAHGKTLVSVAEDMDFGTPTGRLMARQLVMFAEYERELIRSRVKDAYDSLHQHGQYAGMQFPFGYVPVKLEPKGFGFQQHPVYAPKLAEVVDRLLAGESLGSICRSLDADGIPTPRNAVREYRGKRPLADAHWKPTSLTKILNSPAIVGAVTANGRELRDDSGLIVKRAEPIIDHSKWERAKAILRANASRTGPRANSSPLLRIAFCLFCNSPLYVAKVRTGGKEYRYYLCPKANRDKKACASRRVPADMLERYVEHKLLAEVGDVELTEEVTLPGSDHSTQMAELAEAIGNLSGRIAFGKAVGDDVTALEAARDNNERKLTDLSKLPARPPQTITREMGETWAVHWADLMPSERNPFLRKRGIRVEAARRSDGKVKATLLTGWRVMDDQGQAHGEYLTLTSEDIAREMAARSAPESA